MMSDPVFSPIKLDSIYLIESHFSITKNITSDGLSINITFETPEPKLEKNDNHEYSSIVHMGVRLTITKEDDDKPPLELYAKVAANLSIPDSPLSEDEAHEYLWVNGLSMAYGHIRSHMLNLTNASIVPRIVIPPIYPNELIKAEKQKES